MALQLSELRSPNKLLPSPPAGFPKKKKPDDFIRVSRWTATAGITSQARQLGHSLVTNLFFDQRTNQCLLYRQTGNGLLCNYSWLL